jgi:hypothetical protein
VQLDLMNFIVEKDVRLYLKYDKLKEVLNLKTVKLF